MEPADTNSYLVLSLLVIAWCILHSAMISGAVTEYLKSRLGSGFRFYRLFFNLIAILTLIPVALFAFSLRTQAIFHWDGFFRIIQVLLIGTATGLFFSGGRHYDAGQFLGISQIRKGFSEKLITESGELDTSGILSITRHPWYLAGMLIIWARPLDVSAIIVNVLFTFYLIAGTCLEERKLIKELGEQYLAYQKKVSRLLPYKWLKSMFTKSPALKDAV